MDWTILIWTLFGVMTFWGDEVLGAISGYKNSPTQYHIQTDEGKERFFKYQTYNGQYRKERRLDDGTVVGSYGWVDPTGHLRMTDYIADSKGYRIVKTHMEYVGSNSISAGDDVIKSKKKSEEFITSSPHKHSTKVKSNNYLFTKPQLGVKLSSAESIDSPTNTIFQASTTTEASPTSYPSPSSITTASFNLNQNPRHNPRDRVYVRPGVYYIRKKVPASAVDNKNRNFYQPASNSRNNVTIVPISQFGVQRPPQFVKQRKFTSGELRDNGSEEDVFRSYATPLRSHGTGFIYKFPNQYHKEETEGDGSRRGSFGYVDPFGIRRVIHYNAGRRGFQHKKDFKFVGRQHH